MADLNKRQQKRQQAKAKAEARRLKRAERKAKRKAERQAKRQAKRQQLKQQQNTGKQQTPDDVAKGAMLDRRDWSVPNWNNPSDEEIKKFEEATGYPQYLGGFRENIIKDIYADKQISYYANNDDYEPVYQQLRENTGLNFVRQDAPDGAEIYNYSNRGEGIEVTRTDKDLSNNLPNNPASFNARFPAYGDFTEEGKNGAYTNSLGLSSGWRAKDWGGDWSNFDGSFQTSRNIKLTGDDIKSKNWASAFKGSPRGAETGDWDAEANAINMHTMRHEMGHALGLAGDRTLNKKDPSLMSYNFGIRGGDYTQREYESIKRIFKPYI